MWRWIRRLLQKRERSQVVRSVNNLTVLQRLQYTCVRETLEHEEHGPLSLLQEREEQWQSVEAAESPRLA